MLKATRMVLLLAVAALAVRGLPARAQVQNANQDALALLVKATGYQFAQVPDKDIYLFIFSASDAKGIDRWFVRVSYNNERKSWVVVSCTVIDKEDSTAFPQALKDKLLRYNSDVPGSKFAWDEANGDIDVQWEAPTQFLTGGLLGRMIMDVASTCDDQYNDLVKMLEP